MPGRRPSTAVQADHELVVFPILPVLGSEAVLMVLGMNSIACIGEKLQNVYTDDQVSGFVHGA